MKRLAIALAILASACAQAPPPAPAPIPAQRADDEAMIARQAIDQANNCRDLYGHDEAIYSRCVVSRLGGQAGMVGAERRRQCDRKFEARTRDHDECVRAAIRAWLARPAH